MKRYKIWLAVMACILLAGVLGSVSVLTRPLPQTDTLLLNDIAETAREHFDDPESMAAYDFGTDYLLLDAQGEPVYASPGAEPEQLATAIRRHYPYMPVTKEDRLLGTVVLPVSVDALSAKQRLEASGCIVLSALSMLLCMLLWGGYVRRRIIRPFRKMERFAGEIAAGNLDIPLEKERDDLFGIYTESFDIMREELAAARERELLLKQREKELIASLSHDLRTPVTGIKLTAELMLAQSKEAAAREKLSAIYQRAEQIDLLVEDLFTSTLQELGEMKVLAEDVASPVLHELVLRCDDQEVAEEGTIPECILRMDQRRMEQVLRNIFSNAGKYAGTSLRIGYTLQGDHLCMSIRDFGPGVPEEELLLLTNKFYRSSTVSRQEGSGLGLYIANTLMESMGGRLRCLNADPGFEVRLMIPLA